VLPSQFLKRKPEKTTSHSKPAENKDLTLSIGSSQALFRSKKNLQNFSDSPSHRIFGHMHEALNIDKK
jgi:hypothetical protein